MGTTSTNLAPLVFTGVSQYSSDLQSILQRAVQIAQIPATQLQNQDSDVLQKKTVATSLGDAVSNLAGTLTALGAVGDNAGVAATSSDTTKVSILNSNATSPTTYAISHISSLASAASETSLTGYANSNTTAVSSTASLQLSVGSTNYSITLTSQTNNLVGLRDAINKSGAGVTATILTTGTGANPNYLSITSTADGAAALKLTDNPTGAATALLTSSNPGSDASFQLNGVPVTKSSNTINDVVPGVSFSLQGTTTGSEQVTISLASDRSKLSSALGDFVTSFNSLSSQVNAQIGPSAGALSGDFLVRQIQGDLRQLTNFTGSGAIKSFADLGLNLDQTGTLSFNQDTFNGLSDSQIASGFTFVSSSTSGFGSLAANFNQISDPISGLIKIQTDQYAATDKRLNDELATTNARISAMQSNLTLKLESADALLAQLTSQQTVLTASISSLNFTLYGKPAGS
jgi:flagellar hook-associated protein 2